MIVNRAVVDGCVVLKPEWGKRVADERALWRSMVTFIALVKGYQNGWVAHQYKDKFGEWPPDRDWAKEIEEPTEEVRAEIDAKIAQARKAYRKKLAEQKQEQMA